MKRAFTLLEILVVIAIMAVVATLSVSDFSFAYSGAKRPPKAVLANTLKLARIAAAEEGEEVSLFFDHENCDFVLRKSFGGEEIFRKSLFSVSEAEKRKLAEQAFEGGSQPEYPAVQVLFYPVYPPLYNFTRSYANGVADLECVRFSPDGSSTPACAEIILNGKRAAFFRLDPLSATIEEAADE